MFSPYAPLGPVVARPLHRRADEGVGEGAIGPHRRLGRVDPGHQVRVRGAAGLPVGLAPLAEVEGGREGVLGERTRAHVLTRHPPVAADRPDEERAAAAMDQGHGLLLTSGYL